jgi:hypothetical protein
MVNELLLKARIIRRKGRDYGCQFLEPLSQEAFDTAEAGDAAAASGDGRQGSVGTLVLFAALVCAAIIPWLLIGRAVYLVVAWFRA